MKFTLVFDCDNAAFGDTDQDAQYECARILRELANTVESNTRTDKCYLDIMDINGNTIGSWRLK